MVKFTANKESFIKLMTKSDEHARRGFELLQARPGFEGYFDALEQAGLFDASRNPAPVPAGEPGYFRISFWDALSYLEAVAKLAGERIDLQLAEKVMRVVRAVSYAREADGAIRDNYHTHRKFAAILGFVPTTVVTQDDVELVPGWLEGEFERGMVGHALADGALPRFLASESSDDWSKASRLLEHCTAVRWTEEKALGDNRKKPVTLVEDHWLKEMIDRNAKSFGARSGKAAAKIFLARLREVFGDVERDKASWPSRPAIEDHAQNHSWDSPENRFVEGLRDVLLSWVDHDLVAAKPFVEALLGDEAEIVRRVAIYVLGQRWSALGGTYLTLVGPRLFDDGHRHELYELLRDRFHEFNDEEKAATIAAIRQLPRCSTWDDPTRRLRYVQRRWVSALAGNGYEPADIWFKELSDDQSLGPVSEHPDFHAYMESWSGPGPSRYSVQELLAFAEDGSIVDRLNSFVQPSSWRGPTTGALVAALEGAVGYNPEAFLPVFPAFLHAQRPFQYGLINGFKRVWDTSKENQPRIDWDSVWSKLVAFIERVIGDPAFWAEHVVEDQDLTPNRNWIPPVISEFLRAGTQDDAKGYHRDLLPRRWSLIETLLEHAPVVVSAYEADAMTQAINSSKGKAIEALFSHALRACRLSDRESGEHAQAWALIQPAFERELTKCGNANYEFSTLAGAYIANLDYMDRDWLRANVKCIFSEQFASNCACALDGLAYAPATRPVYSLLVANGVLDTALRQELKGRHTREKIIQRMALAYLWGDDDLGSPRFSYLFDSGRVEDLEEASRFFWTLRGQDLSEVQMERILVYWDRCVVWSTTAPEPPARLLSSLSRLSCYLTSVGAREMTLLQAVAPYVYVGYNAEEFIEQLVRLADVVPGEVSTILGHVLDTYTPSFDFEDNIKTLLRTLSECGRKADAITHAERLCQLPGMPQLFAELIAKPS